jgi:phosphatidylinositol 4-kinase type 2
MTNFHSTGTLSKFRFSNNGGGASSRQQDQLDVTLHVTSGRASQSRAVSLTTQAWATVKDLKDQIGKTLAIPPSAQRLHDLSGPLCYHGRELPNRWTLIDISNSDSNTLELLLHDTRDQVDGCPHVAPSSIGDPATTSSQLQPSRSIGRFHQPSDISIVPTLQLHTPKALLHVLHQCRAGFAAGFKPALSIDGSGGAYFLHDAYKHKVAVFKPADEEPYAANNPRGYVNTNRSICQQLDPDEADPFSLRAGIIPGESCLREVAAFLLDRDGFSGVPPTTLVEARHEGFHFSGTRLKVYEGGASIGQHVLPTSSMEQSQMEKMACKIGSLQEFVQAECTMDDLSPSKISTDEVHKIAILDIRLMNADRNTANLLCRRRKKRRGDSNPNSTYEEDLFELVPIDHGYCLRSVCDVSWFDWCWLDWPQVKQVSYVKFSL